MLRRGGASFGAAVRYASRGGSIPRNLRAKSTSPAGGTATTSGGRGPVTWAALVGFGAAGTGLVAYYAREKERRMEGMFLSIITSSYFVLNEMHLSRGDETAICGPCLYRRSIQVN